MRPIERVAMPDPETFMRDYVARRTPVVITNLLDGHAIREITTLEQARQLLADVRFFVQSEYTAAAAKTNAESSRVMTFAEYWDAIAANPSSDLCCTEHEIPARLLRLYRLPEVCVQPRDEPEILNLPKRYGDHDLATNFFFANRGNKAHLHYDGDHRQVLLYQVFGRKEVILFPPSSGMSLDIRKHRPPNAGIDLEHMSDAEKDAFVERANGWRFVLHPGETVYMPSLIWHYLEYTDHACSLNLRCRRTSAGRFLSSDNFHRDYYTHLFGNELTFETLQEPRYQEALTTVIAEYVEPYPTLRDKIRAMRAVMKRLCKQLVVDDHIDEYCPADSEEAEIGKILDDLGPNTLRYASPEVIARSRPTGPINATQKRHIQDGAKKHGYAPADLERLLGNRLGKPHVDQLTQTEAAQFLAYLRSPSAPLH